MRYRYETSHGVSVSRRRAAASMPRRSSTGQQGSGKKARKAKGQADSVEHHEIDDDLFMLGGGGEGRGRGERRTSSRVVGGQSSGGTDQDAIALAKSFYHGPQKNQMVLNVEGRGSCTVFALGASIGLNVKHVVESGDSLGNEITTVHANDRVIDLLFRSGAQQTLYDHYQGRQTVQHPRCIQWFTDQLVQVDARDSATFACVKEVLILQPTSRLLKGVKRLLDESDGQHKKTKV